MADSPLFAPYPPPPPRLWQLSVHMSVTVCPICVTVCTYFCACLLPCLSTLLNWKKVHKPFCRWGGGLDFPPLLCEGRWLTPPHPPVPPPHWVTAALKRCPPKPTVVFQKGWSATGTYEHNALLTKRTLMINIIAWIMWTYSISGIIPFIIVIWVQRR